MVCLMYYIMHTYLYCFIGNSLCGNLCTLHVTRTRVVFIACLSFYSLFYDDQACVKGARRAAEEREKEECGWLVAAEECEGERGAESGTKKRLLSCVRQKVCIVTVKHSTTTTETATIAMYVMRFRHSLNNEK